MKATGVGFLGLGVALPEEARENSWWSKEWLEAETERRRADLFRQLDAGIERGRDVDPEVAEHARHVALDPFRGTRVRHIARPDERSSQLEEQACRRALARSQTRPEEIELFIDYAQVPDYPTPGNHALVANKLGLPVHAPAWTVDAGCASFIPHTLLATRLIQAGDCNRALLCQSSTISQITNYELPASPVVGDGAVASVMGPVEDGYGFVAFAQRTRGDLHGGIVMVPEGDQAAVWHRGDKHKRRLVAGTEDRAAAHQMGARAASRAREVCEDLFAKTGLKPADVDFVVMAQPTWWFGAAVCDALGLDPQKRLLPEEHFERTGHLLPASAPMNLYLAHEQGRIKRGDLVLVYSPGAGFIQAAFRYRWNLPASG